MCVTVDHWQISHERPVQGVCSKGLHEAFRCSDAVSAADRSVPLETLVPNILQWFQRQHPKK